MIRRIKYFFCLLLLFVIGLTGNQNSYISTAQADNKTIIIGTGNITGIYYPAGGAICRLINRLRKDHGIRCSVESTSGSLYNLQALKMDQIDLGIVQSDLQYESYIGVGVFSALGENKQLRSLLSLHNDAFTVVTRADSGIKSFKDIKGKRINIDSFGSGSRTVMELLMQSLNWKKEDFLSISEFKVSEQPEALCSNKIDVMIYSVGHPNAAVQEAVTSCDVSIVPIENEIVDALIKNHPYYTTAVIPGGMYSGNPHDIKTFGVKSTLVADNSLDEVIAYQVVKSIFDNFDSFKGLHPVFTNLVPRKMVAEGNTAPLHKGAEKYYKEKGML